MALPEDIEEFRNERFWTKFFDECHGNTFNWYATGSDLRVFLEKLFSKVTRARVLEIGCGNSDMCLNFPLLNCSRVVGIDYCSTVVEEMRTKAARVNESRVGSSLCDVEILCMDMRNTSFEDGSFDVVIDKAALDALAAEDTEEVARDVQALFLEVERVVSENGGRYIVVTLAEPHILRKILKFFGDGTEAHASCGWYAVLRSFEPEGGSKLQPFFAEFTRVNADSPKRGQIKVSLPLAKMTLPLSVSSFDVINEKLQDTRENYSKTEARRRKELELKTKMSVLEVKPWDDETDPADLEAAVREVTIDGLEWKKAFTRSVAYGIKTVVVQCVQFKSDMMCDLQDVIDELEGLDLVQSAEEIPFCAADWR